MNENILREMGFGAEVEKAKKGICPFCSKKVNLAEFTDPLSVKEFGISGLCQKCQGTMFGV